MANCGFQWLAAASLMLLVGACEVYTPGPTRVVVPGASIEVGDGYRGPSGPPFCPPGQRKKGRC